MRKVAFLLALVLLGSTAGVAVADHNPPRDVPMPTVTGPVTGGVQGHPFGALAFDPAEAGYVEEEFHFGGQATAVSGGPVVLASNGSIPATPPAPYTTRMIVRRPADLTKFNGTVVVEAMNVTSGYDFDAAWGDLRQELLRSGYAYAGVTAQVVGVNTLKAWDPVRYAPLVHPGDQYSYDIVSQAAEALRQGDDGPLAAIGGATRVIATGTSQSGSLMNRYVRDVIPHIERVVDAVLPMTAAGALGTPAVPVLRVLTEWEVGGTSAPDDTNFVQWEIAGATHTDSGTGAYFTPIHDRDFRMPPGVHWPLTPRDQPNCMIGSFPKQFAIQAALDALNRWVVHGNRPPAADRITIAGGAVARDEQTGNATGGLRLPAIDAPTFTSLGESENECAFTLGKTIPFTRTQLVALYGDEKGYVAAVKHAASEAARRGHLLRQDVSTIVDTARQFGFPT